jgi:hypothetical protein
MLNDVSPLRGEDVDCTTELALRVCDFLLDWVVASLQALVTRAANNRPIIILENRILNYLLDCIYIFRSVPNVLFLPPSLRPPSLRWRGGV